MFLHHFASDKRYHKTSLSLFSIRQQGRKTLREYIHHFNKLDLEVPSATSKILVSVFSQGLVEGKFFKTLAKKLPINYDNLMGRTKKYINIEEAQWVKKLEPNILRSRENRRERKSLPIISHPVVPTPFASLSSNKRPTERATQISEGEWR